MARTVDRLLTRREALAMLVAGTAGAVAGSLAASPPRERTAGNGELVAAALGGSCLDEEEARFALLLNAHRAAHGLPPMAASQTLSDAADHHSASMATNDYFAHDLLPDGVSWSQNMTDHGYGYDTWRGENIAAGRGGGDEVFAQWEASPHHNEAMLGTEFVAVGIGRAYWAASTYGWYWTTDFGGVADAEVVTCALPDVPLSVATLAPAATVPTSTPVPVVAPTPAPWIAPTPTSVPGLPCTGRRLRLGLCTRTTGG